MDRQSNGQTDCIIILPGTEWHKVAEVGYGMTLEDIRQKLVRALELFPSVIYGSNLDSCSPQEFDDLMEEIGSSEVSR